VTVVASVGGVEVTAREAEVLALIARHLTNVQIAEALFISQRTVESHVSAMLRKLQLPDRAAWPGTPGRCLGCWLPHRRMPTPGRPYMTVTWCRPVGRGRRLPSGWFVPAGRGSRADRT